MSTPTITPTNDGASTGWHPVYVMGHLGVSAGVTLQLGRVSAGVMLQSEDLWRHEDHPLRFLTIGRAGEPNYSAIRVYGLTGPPLLRVARLSHDGYGLYLDGRSTTDLIDPTAAIIVVGAQVPISVDVHQSIHEEQPSHKIIATSELGQILFVPIRHLVVVTHSQMGNYTSATLLVDRYRTRIIRLHCIQRDPDGHVISDERSDWP